MWNSVGFQVPVGEHTQIKQEGGKCRLKKRQVPTKGYKPQWRNGSVVVLQTIGGGSNPSWGTKNKGVSAGS